MYVEARGSALRDSDCDFGFSQVAEACSAAADVVAAVSRACSPATAAAVRPHAELVARALQAIRGGGSTCQRRYRDAEEAEAGNGGADDDGASAEGSDGVGRQDGAQGAGGEGAWGGDDERDNDADEDDEEAWAAGVAAAADDEAEGMEEADLVSTAEEALHALEKAFGGTGGQVPPSAAA